MNFDIASFAIGVFSGWGFLFLLIVILVVAGISASIKSRKKGSTNDGSDN